MKFNLNFAKDIKDMASRLMTGLSKLSFDDNFDSFRVQSVTIRANDYVSIQNKLTFVPDTYIICNQIGNGIVTKYTPFIEGSTREWDYRSLYLYNNGPDDVTVSIIFMR